MSRSNNEETVSGQARKKIVKIFSLDPKYRVTPYPAVPAEDLANDTYITGQQFIPNVTKPDEFLTKDEMTGKKPLTAKKMALFPFVINPLDQYNIVHGMTLDLSTDDEGRVVNPKDKAIFTFLKLQEFIAPSKSEYRKSKHYFYIDDREAQAEKEVRQMKTEFVAQQFIYKNTTGDNLKNIGLLLGYYIKGFPGTFPGFTDTMILGKLLQAAKEHPAEVMRCDTEEAKNELFVLRLVNENLLKHRQDGFFDGGTFLGSTPMEAFIALNKKENELILSRCTQGLMKKEEGGR